MEQVQILFTVLMVIANALAAILWFNFISLKKDVKKLELDVMALREAISGVKFNYLDRFDGLKQQIAALDLCFTEKIVKLTTLLELHLEKNPKKR